MTTRTERDTSTDDRLIVALDVDTEDEALGVVMDLGDSVGFYKVGFQLFIASGVKVVTELALLNKKIFLDLKLDDTPRTVEKTVKNMATHGVRFFTLQGNSATARAAKAGRGNQEWPLFLQVTLLSSWDESDLREMLHIPDVQQLDLDDVAMTRARKIRESGCDGVIASGTSVRKLREAFPGMVIVTPGIRPEGTGANDHKRTLTPYEAIMAGADYLVVGRPIRTAPDRVGMVRGIKDDIRRALRDKDAKKVSLDDPAFPLKTVLTT